MNQECAAPNILITDDFAALIYVTAFQDENTPAKIAWTPCIAGAEMTNAEHKQPNPALGIARLHATH